MSDTHFNKFRAAIEVLQRGRDTLIEGLADEILDQGSNLSDGGFLFNEFLETQGTRVHFVTLLISQLEQSAESLDEVNAALQPPPPPKKAPAAKKRTRSKKIPQQASQEQSADDV